MSVSVEPSGRVLRHWFRHSPVVAWIVLFACLGATFGWWWHARTDSIQRAQAHFARRINEVESLIAARLDDYEHLIRSARGLFTAMPTVGARQWQDFVVSQALETRFPGARALAFARYIPGEQRDAVLRDIRADVSMDFAITPPGTREEYAPIVFGSGITAKQGRFIGADQLAMEGRAAAAREALATGAITASAKLVLPPEAGRPSASRVLLYDPVFRNGLVPRTEAARKAALVGFVVCPISVEELLDGIFGTRNSDLDLEIFDGPRVSRENQLFDADLAERMFGAGMHSRFVAETMLTVFGRQWLLVFSSLPSFEEAVEAGQPTLVLIFGIAASLLMFGLTWSLARTRSQALWLAAKMTAELQEREYQYGSLLEQASDAILIANSAGRYIDANAKACELLGYSRDELLKLNVDDLLPPRLSGAVRTCLVELRGGQSAIRERQMVRRDGTLVPVEISAKMLEDGRLQEFIRDITDRQRAEAKARLTAAVFETTSEGIVITDPNNRIVSVNPAFTRITEYREDEVVGQDPKILRSGRHDVEFYEQMWESLRNSGTWRGEVVNRRKGGEVYNEWLSINLIRDPRGEIANYVAVISDITERKISEARIQHLAHHDPLTDLPNRTLLHDRLDQAIRRARREHLRLALLFLDLDRFKPINDTLGHKVGDLVLQHTAKVLLDSVRDSDTVARLGGDEFVVLLQDVGDGKAVYAISDKIRAKFAESFLVEGHQINLAVSIGIAIFPDDATEGDLLLRYADGKMYDAKKSRETRGG